MNRKALWILLVLTVLETGRGPAQAPGEERVPPELEARLRKFFVEKHAQARALASEEKQEQASEVWEFFTAGENGDWATVADLYRSQQARLRAEPRLKTIVWQPVIECIGAYEQCSSGEEKYVTMFARELLDSLPRGSIYFGGTDPGRFLPTAFSKSHLKGDPVFVLTQNALTDAFYLKYLRTLYGDRLAIPSDRDLENAIQEYRDDARQRLKAGKLKPGENVTENDGQVNFSGQVSVIGIRTLLAKKVFESNPRKEFFIEESFPLEWMYPHLSPHGLIMKLNREPLDEMSKDTVRKDQDYWMRFTDGALGKWLKPTTSVEAVCAFAEKVLLQKDMEGFTGDAKFVKNEQTRKTFSKLRSSVAGVYAWRAKNSASADERQRMTSAADFAFRQAFALCPSSPEVVFRYVSLLVDQKRIKEARRLVEVVQNLDPTGGDYFRLLEELDRMR
jgi:hypothetical protein